MEVVSDRTTLSSHIMEAPALSTKTTKISFADSAEFHYFDRCPQYDRLQNEFPLGMSREAFHCRMEPLHPEGKNTRGGRMLRVSKQRRRQLLRKRGHMDLSRYGSLFFDDSDSDSDSSDELSPWNREPDFDLEQPADSSPSFSSPLLDDDSCNSNSSGEAIGLDTADLPPAFTPEDLILSWLGYCQAEDHCYYEDFLKDNPDFYYSPSDLLEEEAVACVDTIELVAIMEEEKPEDIDNDCTS